MHKYIYTLFIIEVYVYYSRNYEYNQEIDFIYLKLI